MYLFGKAGFSWRCSVLPNQPGRFGQKRFWYHLETKLQMSPRSLTANRSVRIGKEEVKPPLHADGLSLYLENPEATTIGRNRTEARCMVALACIQEVEAGGSRV
jgi:hypothetical protein